MSSPFGSAELTVFDFLELSTKSQLNSVFVEPNFSTVLSPESDFEPSFSFISRGSWCR